MLAKFLASVAEPTFWMISMFIATRKHIYDTSSLSHSINVAEIAALVEAVCSVHHLPTRVQHFQVASVSRAERSSSSNSRSNIFILFTYSQVHKRMKISQQMSVSTFIIRGANILAYLGCLFILELS